MKYLKRHVQTPEGPGTVVQDFSGVTEWEPEGSDDGFVRVQLDVPKTKLNLRTKKEREVTVTYPIKQVKIIG